MKKTLLSVVFLFATIVAFGQIDTIPSTLTNTNSGSAVSFEVTATSATNIVGIGNVWHPSAGSSQVWIRTGGVGGTAGGSLTVNAANGWTLHQTISVVGNSTKIVWLSNLNPISIPAAATVGIVITGNMYYHGTGSTPITTTSFAGSFATLKAGGPTNGFGGSGAPPTPMTFTPRGFIGAVALSQATTGACPPPTGFTAPTATIECDNMDVTWTPATGSIVTGLLWDTAGFDPTTGGNLIVNAQTPQNITSLTPGTAYDFYLIDSCAAGLSAPVFLSASTVSAPLSTLAFSQSQTSTTPADAVVTFDATASTDYTSVNWEFGDGTPDGTNAIENHTYTQNQTYTVTLTLTNGCGSVDSTFTVNVTGIGIGESDLSRTLNIFPNPTNGAFTVAFDANQSTDVRINVLDIYGRLIEVKEMGVLAGAQNIAVDLNNKASGIYIVQIVTNEGTVSRRITLRSN